MRHRADNRGQVIRVLGEWHYPIYNMAERHEGRVTPEHALELCDIIYKLCTDIENLYDRLEREK